MKTLKNLPRRMMRIVLVLSILFGLQACESLFEYSPYEINVRTGYHNTTRKNIDKLEIPDNRDSIIFAVFSDPHYHYYDLTKAVEHANHNLALDFVVCAGDLTDQGLLKEFELFHNAMSNLEIPWFTVIGNHDYRSNGEQIYYDMFGSLNYSVEAGFLQLTFFDDVFWESDKMPDFDWLENELGKPNDQMKILVAHIPPDSDQFDEASKNRLYDILKRKEVGLGLHGHAHGYYSFEEQGIQFVVTSTIPKRSYTLVTAYSNHTFKYSEVKF